jgi:hypothetical protein
MDQGATRTLVKVPRLSVGEDCDVASARASVKPGNAMSTVVGGSRLPVDFPRVAPRLQARWQCLMGTSGWFGRGTSGGGELAGLVVRYKTYYVGG